MARKKKPPKPWCDTEITCPNCQATLDVQIFKNKVVPATPAEYEYEQRINVKLLPTGGNPEQETKAEKKEESEEEEKDLDKII